jgi:hypothetical protein
LSRAIRARQFQTPLSHALSVRPDEPQAEARSALDANRFDYAPVSTGGSPIGYVVARELSPQSSAPVEEQLRPIGPREIVSADAPFRDLLHWMDRGILFVLDGNELTGFVTPSDANRQEARSYFYLLLAEVEVGLADVIRDHFVPVQSALAALPESCSAEVQRRMEADRGKNLDGDVVSYFLFSDLVKVIGRTTEIRPGYSRHQWEATTGSLVDFRNWVMHPSRTSMTSERSVAKLVKFNDRLNELVDWLATLGEGIPSG